MKKFLFASLFLASAALMQAEVKFGIQAGVNHNALSTKVVKPINHQLGIGFYVGGQAEIFFSEKFSLTPELQYAMVTTSVGGSKTVSGTKYSVSSSSSMSQIELPIMLKFYPIQGLSIDLGPRLSYIVGGSGTDNAQVGDTKTDETYTYKAEDFKYMNTFNIGIGVGLGYRLSNGLGFNARYNFDFIDRVKDDKSEGGSKVGGVQLGLSYQF